MPRRQIAVPLLLLALMASACEEAPKSTPAETTAAATASAAPVAAPAPTPTATTPPAPKVKKKLEDCAKGPEVEFTDKAFEDEVRKKLPKPDGAITKADLKRLRSLNLSQLKLAELDVCVFSQMTGLKELFLGPGEYDDLSPLAGATRLESLRASISQVSDLSPLARMTLLDRLDLGRTQVADLKPLAELKNLSELQIDDTPVEDLSPLSGLSKLERLSVKRTKVKDVKALEGLKNLKFLYIGGSPLDEDAMSLAPVRKNATTKIISD